MFIHDLIVYASVYVIRFQISFNVNLSMPSPNSLSNVTISKTVYTYNLMSNMITNLDSSNVAYEMDMVTNQDNFCEH